MPIDLILPLSLVLGIVAWSLVFAWYVHPRLHHLPFPDAARPLLILHTFRYIGLMFLVPGVTAAPLEPRFAAPAAYGDLVAALLALVALAALRLPRMAMLPAVWIFNLWGFADLVNAVGRGLVFTEDGSLGATFWIPALIVPLLLVSHGWLFGRLLAETRRERSPARSWLLHAPTLRK